MRTSDENWLFPPRQKPAGDDDFLIIDSFAGGGGASTGIEMGLGRSPDIAINHSADALAMHEVNHPETLHLSKNIWQVDPLEVIGTRKVGLAWFSPDCKHFSKAKGSKPVKRNIRDLAWVVVLWAKRVRPRVIMLENVEEFRHWGPIGADGKPCDKRKGQTFDKWVGELRRLGYRVEFRELRACDYGAPTIRKRLFMIARRDGLPIVWPHQTHGAPDNPDVLSGKLKPWRTAAEIIDWTLPCPSIFDTSAEIKEKYGLRAIRPLADATMRRIAKGVMRYVIEAKKPFIVVCNHGGDWFRGQSIDDPMQTLTAARDGFGVVVPTIVGCGGRAGQSAPRPIDRPHGTMTAKADTCLVAPIVTFAQHGGAVRDVDAPLHTITASPKDQNAIIAPSLISVAHTSGNPLRHGIVSPEDPCRTVTRNNDYAVVAPYLVPRYQEREGQQPRTRPIDVPTATIVPGGNEGVLASVHLHRQFGNSIGSDAGEPVGTITAGGAGKAAVVSAFLAQHNTGVVARPADAPLSTLTGRGTQQNVVAAHLLNLKGSARRDAPVDAPGPTITAGGGHAGLISAFLTKYYGQGVGASIDQPLHTDTTKERFGLVTVDIDGTTYAIVDIGMRMLTPRERFRAQGFPDSYIIDRRPDGTPLTQTVQGSCCGNSVCPPLAEALVKANCQFLVRQKAAA